MGCCRGSLWFGCGWFSNVLVVPCCCEQTYFPELDSVSASDCTLRKGNAQNFDFAHELDEVKLVVVKNTVFPPSVNRVPFVHLRKQCFLSEFTNEV